MKAAVLEKPTAALQVSDDLEIDGPQAGEVLVRVSAAGVCHSDYHYMQGHLPHPMPVVLGHEGAGIVEAVGKGVTTFAPGDAVVLMWRPRCGRCRYCLTGKPALCRIGDPGRTSGGLLDGTSRLRRDGKEVHHFLGVSCFAELCVVSELSLLPMPDAVEPQVGAIVGCAVVTGLGAIFNVAKPGPGRSILIIGAGGVGLSAVMGARLVGAHPIVVADLSQSRLDLAADLGASHTMKATEDFVEQVLRICSDGVDSAIEAVGLPETVEQAVGALSPGGTAVAIGLGHKESTFTTRINHLVQADRTIRGSLYGSANSPLDIPRIFKLYQSGKLPLEKLRGRQYSLSEINKAYAELEEDSVGRSLILPGLG